VGFGRHMRSWVDEFETATAMLPVFGRRAPGCTL